MTMWKSSFPSGLVEVHVHPLHLDVVIVEAGGFLRHELREQLPVRVHVRES